MKLMGFTDELVPVENIPCPVSDETLDILACAASHKYFKSLWKDGVSDGFVHRDKEDDLVQKVVCGSYEQCNCSAHRKLLDPSLNEYDREELIEIIRSPSKLCPTTGNAFAVCLLTQLYCT
jgi:hypothetical protein